MVVVVVVVVVAAVDALEPAIAAAVVVVVVVVVVVAVIVHYLADDSFSPIKSVILTVTISARLRVCIDSSDKCSWVLTG